MKRICVSILLVLTCLFAIVFGACDSSNNKTPSTNEGKIEAKVELFVEAYNDGDFDTVLTCLDAKTRNAFSALLTILGGIAGNYTGVSVDLSDLFALGISTQSGDFMDLEIEETEIFDEENAVVTTTMKLPGSQNQTIYFKMVYEKGDWFINDMTDKNPGGTKVEGTDIRIQEYGYTYDGGILSVDFITGGKSYSGLMNAKGEIFYYSDSDNVNFTATGSGCCYVEETIGSEKRYLIFNADGERTAIFNSESFDEIIGYGEGNILVHKNCGTVYEENDKYGIIDSEGNWVKALATCTKLPTPGAWSWSDFKYVGENVFLSGYYYGNTEHFLIYIGKSNKAYFLEDCLIKNVNSVLYGYASGWYRGTIEEYNNEETVESLPHYFKIDPNGEVVESTEDEYNYGMYGFSIDTEGEYLTLKNLTTNRKYKYTKFPMERLYTYSGFVIDNNNILIKINGADGKKYFTVIDSTAKQKFEPIECYSYDTTTMKFTEDRIIYKIDEDYYGVVDINGKVLVSASEKLTNIQAFKGGIAKVSVNSSMFDNGTSWFIGLDGKKINITLKA